MTRPEHCTHRRSLRTRGALRDELEAQRKPLAELELDAAARIGGLEADHVPLDGAALGKSPPMMPQMPCLAMSSKARSEAALDRLPAFDGRRSGAGTSVISLSV